jgi:uncharacterized protein with NRDE domain
LASLRDENPKRQVAKAPTIQESSVSRILAPIDAQSGGTWVGVTQSQHAIILLNGGFTNHEKKTNYERSRGLIVLEMLHAEYPMKEWEKIRTERIEPFTLIVWSNHKLFQLIWDGTTKHKTELDSTVPYLWSSSTLYNTNIKQIRNAIFHEWIKKEPEISASSILEFFRSFTDKENGFIMNRHEYLKTLSYTCIEIKPSHAANMQYHDLLNQLNYSASLDLMNLSKAFIKP